MRASFATTGALILLAVWGGGVEAQDARRVAQTALPSVVLIIVQDANRQPLAQGSGFVVGRGLIATSLHVIEGARYGSVKFAGDDRLHEIAAITGIDERRDLAVLSVPTAQGSPLILAPTAPPATRPDAPDLTAIAIEAGGVPLEAPAVSTPPSVVVARPSVPPNANQVTVGERIYAAGNPLGLEGTISEGIVSGVRHVEGAPEFLRPRSILPPRLAEVGISYRF